ncbi:MAG: hypothetical protein HQ567_29560 [Candidatus Nealsonbacteria bacterium]|nr:hypothetical protein [Candidatus Nealsonbacteria bacterium]
MTETTTGHKCNYPDRRQGNECPTEHAIWLCNSLLLRVASYDHNREQLEMRFSGDLEECLRPIYPGTEVFWTPGKEKAERERLKGVAPTGGRGQLEGGGKFSDFFREIVLLLNDSYHSLPFLQMLARKESGLALAHIFTLRPNSVGIQFRAFFPDNLEHRVDANEREEWDNARDITVQFLRPPGATPNAIINTVRDIWREFGQSRSAKGYYDIAKEQLASHIKAWEHSTSSLGEQLAEKGVAEDMQKKLCKECQNAVQHFALMAIYCEGMGHSSVSYFHSPTAQNRFDSTMVIYWPTMDHEEPDRAFHHILRMLLGLNASPVLQAMAETQRHSEVLRVMESAFRNSGHIMRNRCDDVERQLVDIQGKHLTDYQREMENAGTGIHALDDVSRGTYLAMRSARTLSNTYQTLQLWGFDRIDSFWEYYKKEKAKRERFVSYDRSPLDLVHQVRKWAANVLSSRCIDGFGECSLELRVIVDNNCSLRLSPEIVDDENARCRLGDEVLSAVFYEVLLNAIRHGGINNTVAHNLATVSLIVKSDLVDGLPAMLLCNWVDVQNDDRDLGFLKWRSLPDAYTRVDDSAGKGLGMVAGILHNLDVGSVWHRRYKNTKGVPFYGVAIHLSGMEQSKE